MTYYPHPRRSALKNHFPLANSLFDYALAPGALMIFAYLSYLRFLVAPFVGETCRGVVKRWRGQLVQRDRNFIRSAAEKRSYRLFPQWQAYALE